MESQKFGMPLYGVAWPGGEYIFVGGGGGASNSGIQNRVVVSKYDEEGLHQQIAEYDFGEDAVLKLAVSPDGAALLCALPKGVRVLQVALVGKQPRLSTPGPQLDSMADLVVTCMAFNPEGTLLALGTEDGRLVLTNWPSQSLVVEKSFPGPLKDVSIRKSLVLVALESGKAYTFDHETDGASAEVAALATSGSVRRARFCGNAIIAACVRKAEGHIVRLTPRQDGGFAVAKAAVASKNPITGLDVSVDGGLVACVDSEGHLSVLTDKLVLVKRWPNAHMVFGTEVRFAGDGHAVASVSADASCTVVPCDRPNEFLRMLRSLLGLMIMLLIAYYAAAQVFVQTRLDDEPAGTPAHASDEL